MAKELALLREGDSVRVRKGVMCPDFEGLSIAGWQGRVVGSEQGEAGQAMVLIQWDSVTLSAMPETYLVDSEESGCDFMQMWLEVSEVEPAQRRDSEAEADRVAGVLEAKAMWLDMGAVGKRVLKVIGDADPDNPWESLEAWEKHLRTVLSFPFNATVVEFQERGPFEQGDRVQVLSIAGVDESMGVLVKLKHGFWKRTFPLCDLEAVPRTSPTHAALKDYCTWFANH